ncbi:PQQ-dependent sugar dehydrogenase [Citricoccus nitrophenolicus]|uniref:PQQ-dependent sugar dehydrogenase n=1 Tax=Citricoccus nitrophenolicus TaxID=863575 RepID=UPI0031E9C8CF
MRTTTTARRHRVFLTLALVPVLAVTACTPGPGPAVVDVVASGLEAPWSVAFHEGVPLVSERDSARILELDASGAAREVATVEDVAPRGEGGLLGLAVHEGFLYAYLTAGDENRVERYPLTGGPGALELGEAETVLDGLPAAGIHNGGRIAFGPDGMLYATTGDAGGGRDAQDLDSLAGKILRLTPEGGVPPDNPFEGSPVYSYGHRNPQGIAWDDEGTLYASEFGQNTWDELNVIEAGANYGWPEVEGIAGREGFVDPVQQWAPAEASPSGIAVTEGTIHIANLRGERLLEVPLDALGESSERLVGQQGRLRDVAVAPDGSLWVLTNNTDGRGDPGPDDDRILRLDPEP